VDRYALVGWPLAFSLSAAIHRAAFAAAGVAAEYDLAPTAPAELPAVADRLRAGAWAGANVTVPHKVAIRDLLDEEGATALAVGAVNTVIRLSGGRLRGENTDVEGFEAALGAAAPEPGGGAIVLGAGGAARAAIWALLRAGHRVKVIARRPERSAALMAAMVPEESRMADSGGFEAALLVNATPVGSPHCPGSPWPGHCPLPPAVVDMVAWPLDTPLLQRARGEDVAAVGGLTMLLAQAAASFTAWTGLPAPRQAMAAAAKEAARGRVLEAEGRQ